MSTETPFLECHTPHGTKVHLLGPASVSGLCTCRIPGMLKANSKNAVVMSLQASALQPAEAVRDFLQQASAKPASPSLHWYHGTTVELWEKVYEPRRLYLSSDIKDAATYAEEASIGTGGEAVIMGISHAALLALGVQLEADDGDARLGENATWEESHALNQGISIYPFANHHKERFAPVRG